MARTAATSYTAQATAETTGETFTRTIQLVQLADAVLKDGPVLPLGKKDLGYGKSFRTVVITVAGIGYEFARTSGGLRFVCDTCDNHGSGHRRAYAGLHGGQCYPCNGTGLQGEGRTEQEAITYLVRRANANRRAAARADVKSQASVTDRDNRRAAYLADKPELAAYAATEAGEFVADMLLRTGTLTDNQLAAAEKAMARDAAKAAKAAASTYAGAKGDKVTVTGTVKVAKVLNGEFGSKMLIIVEAAGGVTVKTFSTAASAWEVNTGDYVTVTATVKELETYDGVAQTVVTRSKFTPAQAPAETAAPAAAAAVEPPAQPVAPAVEAAAAETTAPAYTHSYTVERQELEDGEEQFWVIEGKTGRQVTFFASPEGAAETADDLNRGEATEEEVRHPFYDGPGTVARAVAATAYSVQALADRQEADAAEIATNAQGVRYRTDTGRIVSLPLEITTHRRTARDTYTDARTRVIDTRGAKHARAIVRAVARDGELVSARFTEPLGRGAVHHTITLHTDDVTGSDRAGTWRHFGTSRDAVHYDLDAKPAFLDLPDDPQTPAAPAGHDRPDTDPASTTDTDDTKEAPVADPTPDDLAAAQQAVADAKAALPDVHVTLTRTQVDLFLEDREHYADDDSAGGDEDRRALYALMGRATGKKNVSLVLDAGQACDLLDAFDTVFQLLGDQAAYDVAARNRRRAADGAAERLEKAGALHIHNYNGKLQALKGARSVLKKLQQAGQPQEAPAPTGEQPVQEPAPGRDVRSAADVPAFPATWEATNRNGLLERGWTAHLLETRLGQPDRLDNVQCGTATRRVGAWNRDRVLQEERELRGETRADTATPAGTRVRIESTGRTGTIGALQLAADGGAPADQVSVDLDHLLPGGITTERAPLADGVTVLADQTPVESDARTRMNTRREELRRTREELQHQARVLEAQERALEALDRDRHALVAVDLPQPFRVLLESREEIAGPEPTDLAAAKLRLAWRSSLVIADHAGRTDGLLLVCLPETAALVGRLAREVEQAPQWTLADDTDRAAARAVRQNVNAALGRPAPQD